MNRGLFFFVVSFLFLITLFLLWSDNTVVELQPYDESSTIAPVCPPSSYGFITKESSGNTGPIPGLVAKMRAAGTPTVSGYLNLAGTSQELVVQRAREECGDVAGAAATTDGVEATAECDLLCGPNCKDRLVPNVGDMNIGRCIDGVTIEEDGSCSWSTSCKFECRCSAYVLPRSLFGYNS